MRLILNLLINTLAVLTGAYLLKKGVRVDGIGTAVVVAIVLGALNTFLKPILVFFTLPITILTMGLFLIVINAAMILLTDRLVEGFEVANFGWAVLYSLIIALVGFFLSTLA